MPIPKLYLIVSQEEEGQVKIGKTEADVENGAVHARISRYREGLSDNSTVYETAGAYVFEQYLHAFLDEHHKHVTIKFVEGWPELKPREWFNLPSPVLQMLVEAFTKTHPERLAEVSIENLPLFFSGVFSAIHWHAEHVSQEDLALRAALEEQVTSQAPVDFLGSKEEVWLPAAQRRRAPVSRQEPSPLARGLREQNPGQQPQRELAETETTRTIAALVTVVCLVILAATGAPPAGYFFAIIAVLLLALWSHLEPLGVSIIAHLRHWWQDRSRQ